MKNKIVQWIVEHIININKIMTIDDKIESTIIPISHSELELLSNFLGEKIQWSYLDYNRLMCIVDVIEDDLGSPVYVNIEGWICNFRLCSITGENKLLIDKIGRSKIEATWLAVVDFIKWYNLNNK